MHPSTPSKKFPGPSALIMMRTIQLFRVQAILDSSKFSRGVGVKAHIFVHAFVRLTNVDRCA